VYIHVHPVPPSPYWLSARLGPVFILAMRSPGWTQGAEELQTCNIDRHNHSPRPADFSPPPNNPVFG